MERDTRQLSKAEMDILREADVILEECFRSDIPKGHLEVPAWARKELDRISPGYEFVHHAARGGVWVLYAVHRGGGSGSDIMVKQCELPHKHLSPDVFRFLSEMDMGDETYKEWKRKRDTNREKMVRKVLENRLAVLMDIKKDAHTYMWNKRRGVLT